MSHNRSPWLNPFFVWKYLPTSSLILMAALPLETKLWSLMRKTFHSEYFFCKKNSKSFIEVHKKYKTHSNIIKITLRSLNQLMTTTIARASHRHAAVAAQLLEHAVIVHESREVFVHVTLSTSSLEPKSSPLYPWIDPNFMTLNL
jgi:hypothetical protein